jgi:hypothetical protein
MIGRITRIDFTRSGYQMTWIDGVQYKTLWDLGDPKMKGIMEPGARVEFTLLNTTYEGDPYPSVPYARIERIIK